jgi:hypothetical protein
MRRRASASPWSWAAAGYGDSKTCAMPESGTASAATRTSRATSLGTQRGPSSGTTIVASADARASERPWPSIRDTWTVCSDPLTTTIARTHLGAPAGSWASWVALVPPSAHSIGVRVAVRPWAQRSVAVVSRSCSGALGSLPSMHAATRRLATSSDGGCSFEVARAPAVADGVRERCSGRVRSVE